MTEKERVWAQGTVELVVLAATFSPWSKKRIFWTWNFLIKKHTVKWKLFRDWKKNSLSKRHCKICGTGSNVLTMVQRRNFWTWNSFIKKHAGKGPFKYYVIKKVGGWARPNTYVCLHGGWVGMGKCIRNKKSSEKMIFWKKNTLKVRKKWLLLVEMFWQIYL